MWSVMSDQTRTLKTASRCAQFCMLRMSVYVVSLLLVHNGHQDVVLMVSSFA